jgi:hypothetical protein
MRNKTINSWIRQKKYDKQSKETRIIGSPTAGNSRNINRIVKLALAQAR